MRFNQKLWVYYALVAIAIMGSLISLFALFELGSPSWTIPVNMLSVSGEGAWPQCPWQR